MSEPEKKKNQINLLVDLKVVPGRNIRVNLWNAVLSVA